MNKRAMRWAALAAIAICWLDTSSAHAQLRAFGEAEGFGAVTTGARNASAPTIYHVTNLNDSGAGSFRDAVSASNRIIVFDVSGYIHLASAVSAKSNLTILGQTAPGDGIGIYGAEVSFFGQSNDIIRYLRFRDTTLDPGYKGSSSTSSSSSNAINIGSSSNMIFDHVTAEFAAYNNIDAATAPNLTFQNSLVAAPLASQRFNFHWEGGGSAGAWGAGTFVNNVFVDGHNRSILAKGDTQFVNNTVYNYQAGFTSGNSSGNFLYDIANNYFIAGPSTTSSGDNFYQVDSTQSAYAAGNLLDSNKDGTLNGSSDNSVDAATVLSSPWSSTTAQLPTLSAAASYAWNIAHAGDSLKHDPTTFAASQGYDQVDAYMMSNVQTLGTGGRLWTSESQTGLSNGGLGVINSGVKPTDTDGDGIPDAWETAHGMNPNNASDALLLNPLGYRMIEQYANELGQQNDIRVWSTVGGTWTSAANWTGSVTPNPLEYAQIRGNGSANGAVTVSSGTATAMTLSIGGNGPTTTTGEQVTVSTGATLNVYDTITLGDQNNGTLNINGGTVQAYNIILGNTVYLPAATNYTGTINLNSGTLLVSQIVLGAGTPSNWTSGGTMNWSGGVLRAAAQLNVNVPISVSATGGTIDTNSFNGVISGIISGSGGITKTGSGTLSLTGANTYTGATTIRTGGKITGAVANGGTSSAIGASTNLASNLILDGGTLAASGVTDRTFTLTANGGTLDNSSGLSFTSTNSVMALPNTSPTLTLTGSSTAHNTLTPALADPSGGVLSVLKSGTGKWTFATGVKTYSGDTHVTAGTLETLSRSALSPNSNLVLDAGAQLDYHDEPSQSINALIGAGSVVNSFSGSHTDSLTFGSNGGSGVFTGTISSAGIFNLIKTGSGTQTLSGANAFTGTTTINQGTLQLGANNTLPSGVNLALAGGTLSTAGFSDDFGTGTLQITANSHINLGAGSSVLHFAASNTVSWNGTLTIDNWNGTLSGGGPDQIFIGSASNSLTTSQLAHIVFTGSGQPDAVQLSSGVIVPGQTLIPGDLNVDNQLNVSDVQAMLMALTDPSDFESAHNLTAAQLLTLGDVNQDGSFNNADIQALINTLLSAGSSSAPVPEPSASLLAVISAIAGLLFYKAAFRTGNPSRLSTKFRSGFPS